jgi:hypothetical protein
MEGMALRAIGVALALVLCAAPVVRAQTTTPLDVPKGVAPTPESLGSLKPHERMSRAADFFHEHGYPEQPVLAYALLETGAAGDARSVERAREIAPGTPGIQFEVAKLTYNPLDLARALGALVQSGPSLVWLVVLIGGACGAGLLGAAALLAGLGFVRTLTLHAHGLAHAVRKPETPVWAGVLAVLAVLCLLPAAGIGPALLLGAAGTWACLRLPRPAAVGVAIAIGVAGPLLGPGLDYWTRFAALELERPALFAAWRADRAQPLPGDRELLERAVAAEPGNWLYRLALATYWKREGALERVNALLEVREPGAPELEAQGANLQGIARLAIGDAQGAIERFESSRSRRESAAVLFNLSQAHARKLKLAEHQKLFDAARELDPGLIGRYASEQGTNVHRFLIQEPIPLGAFVGEALRASAEGGALADAIRARALGPRTPSWAWLLLPVLAVIGGLVRRSEVIRCRRCDRLLCGTCSPAAAASGICTRCDRLFAPRGRTDPRVREQQSELDRQRQKNRQRARVVAALFLPGLGSFLDGEIGRAGARLLVFCSSAALLLVWRTAGAPFEVGGLAHVLPLALGAALLLGLYVWALLEARRRTASRGAA